MFLSKKVKMRKKSKKIKQLGAEEINHTIQERKKIRKTKKDVNN